MSIGSFCLVLHGHIPYVLRHGNWPHGEDWLFEAAAETYLPLLSVVDECNFLNGHPRITLGITPILLEQLAHEDFKQGFKEYLLDRVERTVSDCGEFERRGNSQMANLAERWQSYYVKLEEQFETIEFDIPKAFAIQSSQGLIEILTSGATHSYLPLLLEDSSIKAQVRAGMYTSQRILGLCPTGIWLPEGAYRPSGRWTPMIEWESTNHRAGIEHFVSDENLTHFFVENHLVENSLAADNHHSSGATVHEPVWVNGNGREKISVAAFARDPLICKQVWCGYVGYPADAAYLEFHKRHGERRGLRYWRVTDRNSDLGRKELYCPDKVPGKIY